MKRVAVGRSSVEVASNCVAGLVGVSETEGPSVMPCKVRKVRLQKRIMLCDLTCR